MAVAGFRCNFSVISKCRTISNINNPLLSPSPYMAQRLNVIVNTAGLHSHVFSSWSGPASNTYFHKNSSLYRPSTTRPRPVPVSLLHSHHTLCQCSQSYLSQSKFSRTFSTQKQDQECEKKPSLFARFKQMYRDYWYVLVPVHAVTSLAWFGGFYYLLKSGVDVVGILETWEISERLIGPLRDSSAGYLAVSYAMYKIFTPLRYTVTLGGTTLSINYLKKWGYIRPIPSREKLQEMYQEKKDNLKERRASILHSVRGTKDGIRECKDNIVKSVQEKKNELNVTTELLKNKTRKTPHEERK